MNISQDNTYQINPFNKEDFKYLLLIASFFAAEGRKWDELRSLKEDSNPSREEQYKNYFDKIFEKGVPSCQLDKGTTLYRARHIKSKDEAELGVCMSKMVDSVCKTFFSEDDIQNMNSINVDFIASEIVQINETKVDFSSVLPLDGN